MTTSYKATARVTVVLDVTVVDEGKGLGLVSIVREEATAFAVEAVTKALKESGLEGGRERRMGTTVAVWPEAVTVKLSIDWTKDK